LTGDETLKAIGELASRNGARVLVDEVYIETLFEQLPRTAFKLGPEFVITSSLTKALVSVDCVAAGFLRNLSWREGCGC